jgi:hypothetical protein
MDHTSSMGGSLTSGTRPNSPNANPLGTKVEGAAQTAHETMDKMVDKTAAQVDRLGGTAHRAVDNAADAVQPPI